MTKRKKEQRRRKVTAFLLALCMVWLMLPPGEARAATPQPEAEIQQTYVDDSTDINAIPAYQPEGDSKVLNYVHSEVFAKGDHIARLKQDETLSSYAFLNRDGTKTVYYLDEAVKFTAADGTVLEKDITLTEALKGYETVQNDIGLHISQNPAAGIQISYNNKQISLLPSGGKSTGKLSGNTVRYDGYYGADTALVYTPTLSGVKEEIILSSYTGQNEFVFYINTGGLTMYPLGDRYYLAESKTDTNRIWLGQIEVFDSNLKPCKGSMTAVTVLQGQRYKLTVTVDEDYLTASDTCYPVTIDPTLSVSDNTHGANAIQDAPIYEGYPTSNFGSYQYNRAGYADATLKRGRTAVKLTGLLNHGDYIDSAAADITSAQFYMADASGTSDVYVFIRALSSNASWTENNVTWNNVGSTASTVYGNIALPAGGFGCFDITQLVKAWKNGSYSGGQCGFVMIGSIERTKDKALYSSEHTTTSMRPYVEVTYAASDKAAHISNSAISLYEGTTKFLTATTTPAGLTVTWSSNNEDVATVSSTGVVTGIKAGKATITASVSGGDPDVCTVYVVKPETAYYIQNVASGYYLDGCGANIAPDNLTNVCQRTKKITGNGQLSQMWKVKYLGNELYSLRPMHKLDMGLHGTAADVALQQIGTADSLTGVTTEAQWSIFYNQNGYVLINKHNEKALYPLSGSLVQDATIVLEPYSKSSTNQEWKFELASSVTPGILLYDLHDGNAPDTLERHLAPDETLTLSDLKIEPAFYALNTIDQQVTWSSSNNSIVRVNESTGAITGVSPNGIATITASKVLSGVSYSKSYTVYTTKYHAEINHHFDDGYSVFFGETHAESAEMIDNYMEIVALRFRELLRLDIECNYPEYYSSALDQCKGTVTKNNLNSICTNHGPNYHHYMATVKSDFMQNYSGNDTTTQVFWSCHLISNSQGYNRSESAGTYVFMVDNSNVNLRTVKALTILFHELCHQYGADDHYHEELENGCRGGVHCPECGEDPRPVTCIMGNKNPQSIDIDGSTVLCDGCKSDILSHLNAHHMYE